jgi:peptide/nickel transport system permease protein
MMPPRDGPERLAPPLGDAPLEQVAALHDPAAIRSVVPQGGAVGTLDYSARRIRREQLGQLLSTKPFLVGGFILLGWIVCAIFTGLLAPYNPLAQNLVATNAAPSATHWLGTDSLGRDVLSRVIAGSRDILVISPLATVLGTVAGTAMGLVQGYFGGVVDNVIGRIVEAVLALPVIIVAFLFVVAAGPSKLTLVLVIGFAFALLIARTVRTAVLQERQLDYVPAARLRGESSTHIMFVEILPNILGPVMVEFTVRLGYAIFTVATLSFLGFGIKPPTPDWGADIAANAGYLSAGYWWETLFPALAIASLVIAINLVADSIEAVIIQ